jgi:O-Antigen ligase
MSERLKDVRLDAGLSLALVPGLLTFFLAMREGGFFPDSTALVAAELALLLVLRLALGRESWRWPGIPGAIAIAALAGLAVWVLASETWSHAPARALLEYVRVLLYLLTLIGFATLAYSTRRIRWTVYGLAAAIVGVCVLGLVARTLPEVILYVPDVHPERLSYPLGYWNSVGVLAAVGIILCGHLASSTRDPWAARVLGAAAVPPLATTLYFTYSRGATWAAVGAVAVYSLVGRPRGIVAAALATIPTTVLALMAANPPGALTGDNPLSSQAVSTGHRIAVAIALCAVAAGVLRALLIPLDRRVAALELPQRGRRPALAALVVGLLTVTLMAATTYDVPQVVASKYREFNSDEKDRVAGYAGSSRLTSAGSNGRREHWEVALDSFRADPARGSGAGTYAIEWTRLRPSSNLARDGHSLYLETLGELGLPGLILVVTALALILGAFAYRARGPDRALFAALLAAALLWAAHAGVDWDWEMPAVTLWLFALGGAALARTRANRPARRPEWSLAARGLAALAVLAVLVTPVKVAVSEARMADALEAMNAGECATAADKARAALDVVPERPTPHHVIAYCALQERRHPRAVRSMQAAVRLDPKNWEFRYGLAIARARAGLDPRREAAIATRLNPLDPMLPAALERLSGHTPRQWRHAVRRLALTLPGPPNP